MNRSERVLQIASKRGVITASDMTRAGISRRYLYILREKGLLQQTGRGLFRLPNAPMTEWHDIAELAKKNPGVVVCLLSALQYHGLTTELPHEMWVAVPQGMWRPRSDSFPLRVSSFSKDSYSYGIEQVDIEGVRVRIYSPAKTVADCFKFRNKIGLGVAIEALREVWRTRRATVGELVAAARVNRVYFVMRPYIEAIIS